MTGITAMEMNEVRPFFSKAMGTLAQLKADNTELVEDGEGAGGDYA